MRLTSAIITTAMFAMTACSGGDGGPNTQTDSGPNTADVDLGIADVPDSEFRFGAKCEALGLFCGGVCTPTQSDPNNCGGCGNVCGEGRSCVTGQCVAPCTARSLGADVRDVYVVENEWVSAAVVTDIDGDGLRDYVLAARGPNGEAGKVFFIEETGPKMALPEATQFFEVNQQPDDIVVRDFDGDGQLDVVVFGAGDSPGLLTVLGSADAPYRTVDNIAPGPARHGFASDWDGDQDLDIIVSDRATVWLGRNDGTARFIFEEIRSVSGEPQDMVALDTDGDGFEELALLVRTDPRELHVVSLTNPTAPPVVSVVPHEGWYDAVPANLDGVGADELLVTTVDEAIALSVDAEGRFTEVARISTTAEALAAADLDEDGRDEVYAETGARWTLDGDALSRRPAPFAPATPGNFVFASAAFDEVLTVSGNGAQSAVIATSVAGAGLGTSSLYQRSNASAVTLAKVDDDDLLDVLFSGTDVVGWLSSKRGWAGAQVQIEDLFGVAGFRRVGDTVETFVAHGRPGNFEYSRVDFGGPAPVVTPLTLVDGPQQAPQFWDVDRDGTDEWLESARLIEITADSLTGEEFLANRGAVAVTDFDGDGRVDLLYSNGDLDLGGATAFTAQRDAWRAVGRVYGVADLNDDGIGDVWGPDGVALGGPLPRDPALDIPFDWTGLVTPFDFDGDGIAEMIEADDAQPWASIRRLDDGTVRSAAAPTGADAHASAVGDIDGDGHLDLVIAGKQGIRVIKGSCAEQHDARGLRFVGR